MTEQEFPELCPMFFLRISAKPSAPRDPKADNVPMDNPFAIRLSPPVIRVET